MKKVLVTCPPMLGMIEKLEPWINQHDFELTTPKVVQTLSEDELVFLVPDHDGWIIGDDPASRRVLTAGKAGRLKAAVKWGIGVDNVDFRAFKDLGLPVTNTPNMFGSEVADIAIAYTVALSRDLFFIDREVRSGNWAKPRGISLMGKAAAVIGLGDIGRNIAIRLRTMGMHIIGYDPGVKTLVDPPYVDLQAWPIGIETADVIIVSCALTDSSFHLLNDDIFRQLKHGARIVNVGRGPVIDEQALIECLRSGKLHGAALDVFEIEPLPMDSYLREHPLCILGSHNSSNSEDAVLRTSIRALAIMSDFLNADER